MCGLEASKLKAESKNVGWPKLNNILLTPFQELSINLGEIGRDWMAQGPQTTVFSSWLTCGIKPHLEKFELHTSHLALSVTFRITLYVIFLI